MRIAILTVSDRASNGEYEDKTGPALAELLQSMGKIELDIVPDEQSLIEKYLRTQCKRSVDVVITNGGTGLSPRDVTPEATLAVATRIVPGIAEAMRAAGRTRTPHADLSRGVAAQRDRTLIINVPGSPKGAVESVQAIIELLPHAVSTMQQPS